MKKRLIITTIIVLVSVLVVVAGTIINVKTVNLTRVTAKTDTTQIVNLGYSTSVDWVLNTVNMDSANIRIYTDLQIGTRWREIDIDTLRFGDKWTTNLKEYMQSTIRTSTTNAIAGGEAIRFRIVKGQIPTADSLGAMSYTLQLIKR